MKFAVLDLETTGGSARMEKITEVAILVYEDGEVIEEFHSLVNPERSVPPFVARMTGLTDKVLADAPKFYEIAKRVVEVTEGTTLVAHNARFDYAFLQMEFQRLGYKYNRKRLCTVQLSKRLVPDIPRHGLDAMIKHFNIHCEKRHRAMDDTRATLELFKELMKIDDGFATQKELVNFGVNASKIPEGLSMEDLQALPESCGVYFFEDADGRYMYIGKSINIKKRIFQHFREVNTKTQELQRHAVNISYETTGSELIALLRESELIKKYRPHLNKAQRKNRYPFVIGVDTTGDYHQLRLLHQSKVSKTNVRVLDAYTSKKSATGALHRMMKDYELCPALVDLEKQIDDPCQRYAMGKCLGACAEIEPADDYNIRVDEAVQRIDNIYKDDMVIIDEGRYPEERSLLWIKDGYCAGYGYVPRDISLEESDLADHITPTLGTAEMNRIISGYVRSHPRLVIYKLSTHEQKEDY